MKITLFLLADYANISQENKLNIMGIFSEIFSAQFPARHSSMFVVIKIAPELGEYGYTRDITIKLQGPDGQQIYSVSGPAMMPKPLRGKRPEINILMNLRDVIFPQPGPYAFICMVDNDHKGELPFNVTQIESVPAIIPDPSKDQ